MRTNGKLARVGVMTAMVAGGLWLSGCSPSGNTASTAAAAPAPAVPAAATVATPSATRSSLKGLELVSLTNLPVAPKNETGGDFCEHLRKTPVSAGGKLAASRGWIITSEAKTDRYDVVTIVSGLEPATSGMCMGKNGNVAVFAGGKLVALGYSAPKSDLVIGAATTLEGGSVRLWSDGPGFVLGDLTPVNGGFLLSEPAAQETLCRGKAIVPNIFGMPIDKARAKLAEKGWKPAPGDPGERNDADFATDLAKRGIVEAESCSGTGMGYCAFNYSGAAGTLSVTTTGDDAYPSVASYSVNCA